jgi:hypothetical protein
MKLDTVDDSGDGDDEGTATEAAGFLSTGPCLGYNIGTVVFLVVTLCISYEFFKWLHTAIICDDDDPCGAPLAMLVWAWVAILGCAWSIAAMCLCVSCKNDRAHINGQLTDKEKTAWRRKRQASKEEE